ncbi:MAG: hypothetical protein ACD_64C00279G0001 [uncultured bacterium]|nr:MAG: hypothetical protein ACD_64C00279G0001 [uncultured bacterium]HLE76310.1 hypothetical protein [Candidatus Babeliales bacterium]
MKHEAFVEGLTKILLKRHLISKSDADSLVVAFKGSQKEYFDDFLLSEGLIEKDDLLPALAEYYQVPAVDVVGYFFDHSLLLMFPKNFLFNSAVIPMERDENMLVMVTSDPNDEDLIVQIGNYVSYDIHFNVGIRQDIMDAVEEYYAQSLTGPDFEEDLSQTREAREGEIEEEKEVNELSQEIYAEDEE